MQRIVIRRKGSTLYFHRMEFILVALFFLSAINQYIALAVGIINALFFFVQKNSEGLLKSYSLYILRVSSMHPVLFSTITNAPMKYGIMLLYAFLLIMISKPNHFQQSKLKIVSICIVIYYIYVSISSLFVSSFPLVSIVKLTLYTICFYSVLKTVAATPYVKWENFYASFFSLINLICLVTVPFMALRTRNGSAFQGIFDQPNLYGIFASLLITFVLGQNNRSRLYKIIIISITIFMQFLSGSRTGLLSSLVIIVVWFVSYYKRKSGKLLLYSILMGLVIVMLLTYVPNISPLIDSFIWKGYEGNLLYSRQGQINRFIMKFMDSPICGTGFMTPYIPGLHSFTIALDLFVEDGNLLFAVIGQTGIVGLILWMLIYIEIYKYGDKRFIYFYIAPFVVSMGEMIFFSTNSVGFFLFSMFAIFLFSPYENKSGAC